MQSLVIEGFPGNEGRMGGGAVNRHLNQKCIPFTFKSTRVVKDKRILAGSRGLKASQGEIICFFKGGRGGNARGSHVELKRDDH